MFSVAQGVYTSIRHVDYVQSNSQIFFENLLRATCSAILSGDTKMNKTGSIVRGNKMCPDTRNTRQCDKGFERGMKQDLLSPRGEEIYSWAYQRGIFMKEEILTLNGDSLGFIQLEMKVETIRGRVKLTTKYRLFFVHQMLIEYPQCIVAVYE